MSQSDIRAVVLGELGNVAPEADLQALDPKADLRTALDIDSMDFLNLVTAIHTRLGIDIPERDYPKLFTLAGAVDYLEAAQARKRA
ncbi:MAG: acyl carrier protein [Bauldia sp.]|nr:acyl carrier protein [Bauldia sp.]